VMTSARKEHENFEQGSHALFVCLVKALALIYFKEF
jgi:hypothetical protein